MARSARTRDWIPELDALRALACAAVLGFHLVWAAGALETDPSHRVVWSGFAQFLLLGAPLFAFLAGLLAFYHYPDGRSVRPFWWNRLLYLGAPYVVWTLAYLVVTPGAVWGVPASVALRRVLFAFLFGARHLGLVAALLQFAVLFPLLRWVWNRVDRPICLVAALLCGVAWIDGGARLLPRDVAFVSEAPLAGCVLAWLPYLALGAWASEHLAALDALLPQPRGLYASSGLLLAASAVTVSAQHTHGRPELVTGRTAWLAVLVAFSFALPALLFLARRLQASRLASLCREVARFSPAVFYAQVLPLALAQRVVPGHVPAPVALLIYAVVTWIGTGILIEMAQKGEVGLLLLGLGRRSGRTAVPRVAAFVEASDWEDEPEERPAPQRALG